MTKFEQTSSFSRRSVLLGGGALATGTMIAFMLIAGSRRSQTKLRRAKVRTVAGAS